MDFIEHTFAICAYKESQYLEKCIKSVINQELKSNVIMTTATPNEYIKTMAEKYAIPLFIREGRPDIQDDWNYAYNMAKTKYVTIAHQDDIYDKSYSKELKSAIQPGKRQLLFFTDYKEIKNGDIVPLTTNLKVKKIMLFPLRSKVLRKSKFVRKRILSLGSPICCPSVTYNREIYSNAIFTSKMKCSLDWDTWHKFSNELGEFVYISKSIVFHRIHEESETTNSIENNVRQSEDYEMFKKFWPELIAKKLAKAYSKSLDTNKV